MSSSSPFLSVVIPSYRRPELILRLLADLYAQDYAAFEVIVVDDCSPDDSVEQFQRAFPQTRIFRNEKNGGPAVARNRGIREAKGEIIVGLDSDVTVPDRQMLAKVVQAYKRHPDATGFAFRLFAIDGVSDDTPRWWHSQPIASHALQSFETFYFSGTAYSFKRASLVTAGLYPEFLYMHYEEVLLAYRLMDQGGRIYYEPSLTVVHHAHTVSRRSEIKVFYKPRNQVLLAIDCLPFWPAVGYALPRFGYAFLTALANFELKAFGRVISSLNREGRVRLAHRKPIRKETLKRFSQLQKKK